MADDAPSFHAACVQMRSGIDRAKNTQDAIALIEEAAAGGAQFIVTPEMTNVVDRKPSRLMENLPHGEELEEIGAFAETAKRLGVWLLIGSMAIKTADRRAANRSFFYSPTGAIVARYDKLHRFDVELPGGESWKESNVYDAGAEAAVVNTPLASIGLSICYDLRFPQLFRQLAQAGAEVLCVPAAFTKQTGEAHWKTLLCARAIENGSFVIAPGQGGLHEDGRETYGHSMIIGPWGEILAEAQNDTPGVIIAEIAVGQAHEARQRVPNLSLEQKYKVAILST